MRTIGLIGGMSWESSAHYYRIVNEAVRAQRGGSHSARCLLLSLDFAEVAAAQHAGDWDGLATMMADAAQALERGGAGLVVLCTNTMHRLAGAIEEATSLPLLHIADPTAMAARAMGYRRVGLIGTAYTMEGSFYRDRLTEHHGLEVVIPDERDREIVHSVIYDELVKGIVSPVSRETYRDVLGRLAEAGAEAVILGCTEIMLLVQPDDSPVPLLDTTDLHARAAVAWALEEDRLTS
jgi:aspartate racemase